MVAASPRLAPVLPAFLEFARGAVLVAHNAPFDVGFLKAACAASRAPVARLRPCSTPPGWPGSVVTARRDAQPQAGHARRRCSTPPRRPTTAPCTDARATVDVLHALLERLGTLGVHVPRGAARRSPRGCTPRPPQAAPGRRPADAPGVYLFRDARGRALYVGTSRDIRTRVRSYFTAAEKRTPDGRDGRDRRRGSTPVVVRDAARGRGARAAADRGAQPAATTAARASPSGALGQAHGRAVPAALRGAAGPSDDGAALPRARSAAAGRRSCRRRAARDVPAAPVHRPAAAPPAPAPGPALLAEMGRCGAPCTGGQSRDAVRRHRRGGARDAMTARRRAGSSATLLGADRLRWRPASASRRRPPRATACSPSCAPRPARSGSARSPSRPELVAARRPRRRRLGARPRPARPAGRARRQPARRRLRPYVAGPAGDRRESCRRPRPTARAPTPRRPSRSCAGSSSRACGSSTSQGDVGLPAARRRLGARARLVPRAARPTRRRAASRSDERPRDRGRRPLRSGRRRYAARPLTTGGVARDHRHRADPGGRRPHPRGRRGDRRRSTASARSTPSPATSTSSPWSGCASTRISPTSSPTGSTRSQGVRATETHIAFRAYSQHDLEAAFALGFDDEADAGSGRAASRAPAPAAASDPRGRAAADCASRAGRPLPTAAARRSSSRRQLARTQRRRGAAAASAATSAAAALSSTASRTGPGSPAEHVPRHARRCRRRRRRAGPRPGSRGTPERPGRGSARSTAPPPRPPDACDGVGVVSSSRPSSPRNTSALRPRVGEHARDHRRHPPRRRRRPPGARGWAGLVSGPRKLKAVGTPSSRRGRGGVPERRVEQPGRSRR